MLATGVAVGTVTAMLGAVLISLGMWQKARMEEGFLTAELGADEYGSVLPARSDAGSVPAAPLKDGGSRRCAIVSIYRDATAGRRDERHETARNDDALADRQRRTLRN
jgi:hypothetical protein